MSARSFYSLAEAAGHFGPCALAIGNFDGVHVGHQSLIASAVQFGREHNVVPAALTFDPHPATVVAPARAPKQLCTLEERVHLLHHYGAEHVLVLPFTYELSLLSPEAFVSDVLCGALDMRGLFVGENFRFGHKQAGTIETIRALGQQHGFAFNFLQPVVRRGEVVSSSAIRRHVVAGRVARAGRLLGRCYSLCGPVVPGQGIGSKQTVPTLNLRPEPGIVLPRGVFVTETLDTVAPSRRWESITNVGNRPTFGGEEVTIETYLLSPFEGETPTSIEVRFHHFVREERAFGSADELKAQIFKDVGRAKTYWRRLQRSFASTAAP